MRNFSFPTLQFFLVVTLLIFGQARSTAQISVDEQHHIRWDDERSLVRFRRPAGPVPITVESTDSEQTQQLLTLNDAIRLALEHSEVVRVLTGVSAASSGSTIYDTAIATTAIDQAVGRFDPIFRANTTFRHNEDPFSVTDPGDPFRAQIVDRAIGGTDLSVELSQTNRFGGNASFGVTDRWNQLRSGLAGPGSLDPSHAPTLELSYTQPLLAGFGRPANEASIVIARYQLDQSYFQFRDSVQEMIRGVIAAYWSLVQARAELWAREQQVEQSLEGLALAEAQLRSQLGNLADVSQRKVAFGNFNAGRINAQANVLQREAALRNIMGLPPEDGVRLVPSTPPTRDRVEFRWNEIVSTAQTRRPDLVELNLILLADQQRLIQSRNLAQPSLDALAVQRWNGLSGRMLNGQTISSSADNHTNWTLGIAFSVPLGLRQARAQARSQELLISRDRANIQQGLHQVEHQLATTLRNLDQAFLQYEVYRQTREAARVNIDAQKARYKAGTRDSIYLNVLLAISDYGNAVAAEAQALAAYNTELANLERQTGTILETHGIQFTEEQFSDVSAWGKHFEPDCYPRSLSPSGGSDRYMDSGEPSESPLRLEDFGKQSKPERLPVPATDEPPTVPENSNERLNSDPDGGNQPPTPRGAATETRRSPFSTVSFRRWLSRN